MLDYMPLMRHIRYMKQEIVPQEIKAWAQSVGGTGKAAKIIMAATDLAPSTAEKIARGQYKPELQFLIRKALSELTGIPPERLFRLRAK